MRAYLEERPQLVGIGSDPGLVDKTGRFLSQRHPEGRALLVDGVFVFDDEEAGWKWCESAFAEEQIKTSIMNHIISLWFHDVLWLFWIL